MTFSRVSEECSCVIITLEAFIGSTRHEELQTGVQSQLCLKLDSESCGLSFDGLSDSLALKLQSAYRRRHFTETAMVNVLSDIFLAAYNQSG